MALDAAAIHTALRARFGEAQRGLVDVARIRGDCRGVGRSHTGAGPSTVGESRLELVLDRGDQTSAGVINNQIVVGQVHRAEPVVGTAGDGKRLNDAGVAAKCTLAHGHVRGLRCRAVDRDGSLSIE
jgi:hypothetical protein